MTITNGTAELLGKSFARIARDPERFADSFFSRLFQIAPSLAPLFRSDLKELGRKFTSMLGVLVAGLHQFDLLQPMLADCARRHVAYGAEPQHYALVGEALMFALEGVLEGDDDALAAWRETYAAVSQAMIAAAYPARPGAAMFAPAARAA